MSTQNGGEVVLPEHRRAAVEYGLAQFQQVSAERDRLAEEVADLRSQRGELQARLTALASRETEMESRVKTAVLERDQAVRDSARLATVLDSIAAVLRAQQPTT